MARYILIDNCSGFIWGDTGDLDGGARDETPAEAAARLDAHVSHHTARTYESVHVRSLDSNAPGYHVYRADIDGSEAVPLVDDGQDNDTIAAVESLCRYVTTLRCIDVED